MGKIVRESHFCQDTITVMQLRVQIFQCVTMDESMSIWMFHALSLFLKHWYNNYEIYFFALPVITLLTRSALTKKKLTSSQRLFSILRCFRTWGVCPKKKGEFSCKKNNPNKQKLCIYTPNCNNVVIEKNKKIKAKQELIREI